MGKGDKRSRRGKIHIGSTGVTRPKKKKVVKKAVAPAIRMGSFLRNKASEGIRLPVMIDSPLRFDMICF